MFGNLTHNQGVPGSCPGGPTWKSTTYDSFHRWFFVLCQIGARFCVFEGKTGVKGCEGMELY